MYHISGPRTPEGEKAMEPILLTLAFVGGFTGLIIVGTRVNLYFYSHGAIKVGRSRHMRGLRSAAAKSVPMPVQVSTSAGLSDIHLISTSTDPSSRYARGGLMVMGSFFLLIVIAVISLAISTLH
jgi:hypothetical protein